MVFAMRLNLVVGVLLFMSGVSCSVETAAAPVSTACEAEPKGIPSDNQRWVYRTDRTTGIKCWHLAPKRHDAQGVLKNSPTKCTTNPIGSPPNGMQWRYRFERDSGLKCWHLVRKRNSAASFSSPATKNNFNTFNKVAAAQAAAPPSKAPAPQGEAAPSARNVSNPTNELSQSLAETFHSRWSAAVSGLPISSMGIEKPTASPVVVTTGARETSDGAIVGATIARPQEHESTRNEILVATLSSLAAFFAAYVLIRGALESIRRARGRRYRKPPSRATAAIIDSPPSTPGISDVLDRLRREDLDDDRLRRPQTRASYHGPTKQHHA